jgi:hypothetical protein
MTDDRTAWGAGRVAFLARVDKIKADLAIGVPLKAIYAKHQTELGIAYPTFCRLVSRYAADAKPAVQAAAPRKPRRSAAPKPTSPPPLHDDDGAGALKRPAFQPVRVRKD